MFTCLVGEDGVSNIALYGSRSSVGDVATCRAGGRLGRRGRADPLAPGVGGLHSAAIHSDTDIEQWVKVEVIAHREVWVAVNTEDHPLAVMVLHDGWIDQLYVAPAWTGLGLGSRLVELAKSRSPQGLQLWTFASIVGAQRFYERHGFVIAETTDGSGNEENEPDLRLVWPAP